MSRPTDCTAASAERATLAGLARELEKLYRDVHELRGLSRRVDELATTLAQVAEAALADRHQKAGEPAPCWLDHEAEPGRDPATSHAVWDAKRLLSTLGAWVGAVYLRYSDAVAGFPDCWLWHPDVVEELLWLHHAWLTAYHPDAQPTAVGDWHDRQRPGVVTRIRGYAGLCSLDAHQPGHDRATPAPATPTVEATGVVAVWWATARDRPGPAPTPEQLAAAQDRWRRSASGRR